MTETIRTEAEYLATMPVGVAAGTSVQDLRDALYSLQRGGRARFGAAEIRPLASSISFTDLRAWCWTDLVFPAITGRSNQTDWTIQQYRDTGKMSVHFRRDQDNELAADIQMPHEWPGTEVLLHLHTIPVGTGSGDVRWEGRYFFAGVGDEVPVAASWTTIGATQVIAPSDQYLHKIATIATIAPPAVPGHSDIISLALARMGNSSVLDTYEASNPDGSTAAANLVLTSYDVHYQRLQQGSRDEFSGALVDGEQDLWFAAVAGQAPRLRIAAKAASGNPVEFRLWDVTAGAAVASSTLASTSNTYEVIESGDLTLVAGLRRYRLQGRYTGAADEPRCCMAEMVVS